MARQFASTFLCFICFVLTACGTDGTKGSGGAQAGGVPSASGGQVTGGISATGGTLATGGTTSMGGNGVAGGSMATGGTTSTGGNSTTGGAIATGGTSSSGGVSTSGGTRAASGTSSTGGDTTIGGTMASGGTTSMGGTPAGGVAATGGTAVTGGGKTGGATATGGATGGTKTGGAASTSSAGSTGGAASTGGASSTTAGTGAPESKPTGYGQNATGGGSSSAVDKATMADIQAAIDAYSGTGGLVVRYTGKFDFKTISDPCTQHTLAAQTLEIKNKSNVTIMGADGSAANFGIHIAANATNVIVRNMVFGLLPGGGDSDAISIEGMSSGMPKDIWIDHNELFSSMATCEGAGDTSFDGLIDVKKGADNVTVSYNYLHDHHKVSLNGYSDDDTAVRHITFHHNVFENVGSRTPLQRGGYSHEFSNLFTAVSESGINVRMDGYALVESNWMENSKNIVTSRDSPNQGWWELKTNNIAAPADFTTYGISWGTGSSVLKNADDWTTTKAFPVALGYTYKADAPACVKAGLQAVVGAGKGLATLKCN